MEIDFSYIRKKLENGVLINRFEIKNDKVVEVSGFSDYFDKQNSKIDTYNEHLGNDNGMIFLDKDIKKVVGYKEVLEEYEILVDNNINSVIAKTIGEKFNIITNRKSLIVPHETMKKLIFGFYRKLNKLQNNLTFYKIIFENSDFKFREKEIVKLKDILIFNEDKTKFIIPTLTSYWLIYKLKEIELYKIDMEEDTIDINTNEEIVTE